MGVIGDVYYWTFLSYLGQIYLQNYILTELKFKVESKFKVELKIKVELKYKTELKVKTRIKI